MNLVLSEDRSILVFSKEPVQIEVVNNERLRIHGYDSVNETDFDMSVSFDVKIKIIDVVIIGEAANVFSFKEFKQIEWEPIKSRTSLLEIYSAKMTDVFGREKRLVKSISMIDSLIRYDVDYK